VLACEMALLTDGAALGVVAAKALAVAKCIEVSRVPLSDIRALLRALQSWRPGIRRCW
jgi:hypothetical protein